LVAMITALLPSSSGKFATAHIIVRGKEVPYGQFVNALISFLLVAAVVFFLIVKPINKLNEYAARNKDTGEPETKKCEFCLNVIPTKATRCGFCTSKLEEAKS
ncbi:MscL family protein, partial [Candidatus Saccharibacteria bacterium]|nr:MscL family protein [Candidatus Saccharibacteria bacterium]